MIEKLILENLISNEEYARKTIPFLKDEYFHEKIHRIIFFFISKHITKYNVLPNISSIKVMLDAQDYLSDTDLKECYDFLDSFDIDEKHDLKWLIDTTEEFCQEKAIFNAVKKSILIIDGQDKSLTKGALPDLLTEALSVSFDKKVGHDYIENAVERYDFYQKTDEKISCNIEYIDKVLGGGFAKKALFCFMGGTGVGKSLVKCSLAANMYKNGANVLYITLELSEERVSERIDANLLDISLEDLSKIDKTSFLTRISKLKSKNSGRFITKEYPTSSANVMHFRYLLNELKLKKNFVPDVIFVDYLNICSSSRVKNSGVNSYTYIKMIAEELRGLAIEQNVPVITSTQSNRSGSSNSDVELENVSESFGLPATTDAFFAIISTEELAKLNQYMFKQLKNRFSDINRNRRFIVGVDKNKMRLYDVEQSAQVGLMNPEEDTFSFDKTRFGKRNIEFDF